MGKDQELLQAVKTEDLMTVQKLLQRPKPGKASRCFQNHCIIASCWEMRSWVVGLLYDETEYNWGEPLHYPLINAGDVYWLEMVSLELLVLIEESKFPVSDSVLVQTFTLYWFVWSAHLHGFTPFFTARASITSIKSCMSFTGFISKL